MSDEDEGPSTSRSTRRSGGGNTTPRRGGAAAEPVVKQETRESSETSRRSVSTSFASREQKSLHTPTYGGKLFTAPASSKRQQKRNSRFSPEVEVAVKQNKTPASNPAKATSASSKLAPLAAAFEDTSTPGRKAIVVKNLKEHFKNTKKWILKARTVELFELAPDFVGAGGRTWSTQGPDKAASSSSHRRLSAPNPRGPRDSKASKDEPISIFNFDDSGEASTSAAKPKRPKSVGAARNVVKLGDDDEDEQVDHPPRGRKLKEPEGKGRGRPKNKVKEETMSETEEAPTPVAKGRRSTGGVAGTSAISPPAPAPVDGRGRRKSGPAAVVVKEEPPSDSEEQPAGRRDSMRGKPPRMSGGHGDAKRDIIKREEGEEEEIAPKGKPGRKSVKMETDHPSTSVAAAESNRSVSLKRPRGRPPRPSMATKEADNSSIEDQAEPPSKKKKSSRTSVGDEDPEGVEKEEPKEAKKEIKKEEVEDPEYEDRTVSNLVPRPPRRRSSQLMKLLESMHKDEREIAATNRRRVSRGNRVSDDSQSDVVEVATTTTPRSAPRVPKPSTETSSEARRKPGRPFKKPSTSSQATPSSSLRMLVDDSPGAASGYGEESTQERETGTESMDEGEKDEEAASSSAAAAGGSEPVKRGRGRPRIYFDRPKQPYPYVPKWKRAEQEAALVASVDRGEGKRQPVISEKFKEYITEETAKIGRRASAGAGMVTTSRTLAAAGVEVAPRPPSPPPPPPPKVKAPTGSALQIKNSMLGKKKLPSIRSPSPITSGRRSSGLASLAAATATLADAPPIKKKEEEEVEKESAPGPSRVRRTSTRSATRRSGESSKIKKEEEEKEEEEEIPEEPVSLDTVPADAVVKSPSTIVKEEEEPQARSAKVEKKKKVEAPAKEEMEEGGEEEMKEEEGDSKEQSEAAEGEKKDTAVDNLLAKWVNSREEMDQQRIAAGLPVLPPTPSDDAVPAPVRSSRRSINAPSRFGDYETFDARKRSATVSGLAAQTPLSPVGSETSSRRPRRHDETPTTRGVAGGGEEEEERTEGGVAPAKRRSGGKKERPRLVIKLKLDRATSSESKEGTEPRDEERAVSAALSAPVVLPSAQSAKRRDRKESKKDRRNKSSKFEPKWRRDSRPHMGFIQLDDAQKTLESVTNICADAIDHILSEICGDGIDKSTLNAKERQSEVSRLVAQKRRQTGTYPPPLPPGAPRPRALPIPIPPREERTKRIRHAPQSKEYDNLAQTAAADLNASFQAAVGVPERRHGGSERRKESRQDAASRRESIVSAGVAVPKDVDHVHVEKPKKEKKRSREREKVKESAPRNPMIPLEVFLRQKQHNMERMPGRVLSDPADFFYREIFTDDPHSDDSKEKSNPDDIVDIESYQEPPPDDLTNVVRIGTQSEETASKLLQLLPRPQPEKDEDDSDEDEEPEWRDEDMKKAIVEYLPKSLPKDHSRFFLEERVWKALELIKSQWATNISLEGTKGEQERLQVAYTTSAKLMSDCMPVFSERRQGESTWIHRCFLRLLPGHLLPIYLEIIRFLKVADSKLSATLNKSLQERGVDAEWDALFEKEQTDDDRTEPMLNGSGGASAVASSDSLGGRGVEGAEDDEVAATMDAVLKTLEKAEMEKETPAVEEAAPKKPKLDEVLKVIFETTDKKVREANQDMIYDTLNPAEMADVIPILISPVWDIPDAPEGFVMKNKSHEGMFRMIRYCLPNAAVIKPYKPPIPAGNCTIAEAMDYAIEQVSSVVRSAVKAKGNRRVVLFGWGNSCDIIQRVIQNVYGVSAIIHFGFQQKTLDGYRGGPDDDINLTYCPVLFVMGTDAPDFDEVELLLMRMSMTQPSGALIIGEADENLNVSQTRLSYERITPKIAQRIILDQVIKFINLPGNQLEKVKLLPQTLNNVYHVEPSAVKACTALEAQQAQVPASAARRTIPLPLDGSALVHQSEQRRRQQQEENKKRKRSRVDEQTTVASRLASSIASSAAPPMAIKRSRTEDGGQAAPSYGMRDYRFSIPGPSPLASPAANSPGFRMMSRPAILSHSRDVQHHQYHPALASPLGGPSSSGASSSSGLLLQTAGSRPAPAPAPSPRGPLDPASISLS